MLTLLNLLSGVALLIWGTHIVRSGVLRVYGADLRRVLSRSIANRYLAFVAGLGVTGLVQSSNATALIVASFGAQGLIALAPALAIMLGADVGTALMARILIFDFSWLSPLLICCGVVLFLSRKQSRAGQLGRVAIGLGLILLALQLIVAAAHPMTQAAGVKVLFASLTGDAVLDTLVGAVFAMVSYSSLAAVLLTATLAASGVISLKVALCLVIGANLGSGMLAMLSSSAQNAAGRRVVFGSLIFKLIGAAAMLPFIDLAGSWVGAVSLDPQQTVVNFHVLYNLARCSIFLLFTTPMARLCMRVLPDRPEQDGTMRPRHLDEAALATPTLALANAARETLRMGDTIEAMLNGLLGVIIDSDVERARQTRRMDDDVDQLYTAVKMYLARISREELDEADSRRWTDIISLVINLEHAGDIIERAVADVEEKKIAHRLSFSEAGLQEICDMHRRLVDNLQLGLSVFLSGDLKSAQRLIQAKERFRDLEREYANTHLNRLAGQTVQSIETSSLHLDIISDLKRLNSLFCSTAYPVLDDAGALRKSRLRGKRKNERGAARAAEAPFASPPQSTEENTDGTEHPGHPQVIR
ncbi:Na/Pi cotransporter family protein [Pandoraea sp.]|uniref:Na/Pi cotransporter family protein n=1 Tax=Pandoraea sp. TaxID=1883445 RepID=UPI00121B4B0A|nr:Na/Pi cotransporter family protein [Pandoraea sp.]MBU6491430.1 Na/Pi cotransporter family protein [Burkholderiales bacterium]MDE2287793.1 Na/Pi cotransporter family protein [Burkholderiales bacterium]TAL54214.1 MAG: Na/Pi cotransporter family protein [Pandoraea sp.]TAM15857.1 MAG: Na/Pi cotransporter family protein [Pandoraea sp.]